MTTPEQITAIVAILERVGTWPIGSILCSVFLLPYVSIYVFYRAIEKRFQAVSEMYENNIKLVEHYEKMSKEHVDTIRLNTAASAELISYLKNRVPCYQILSERNRS